MNRSMNMGIVAGVVLIFLGIAAYVVPVFTMRETVDVVSIGDMKLQTQEDKTHYIPPAVSIGAVLIGALLIGTGLIRRA